MKHGFKALRGLALWALGVLTCSSAVGQIAAPAVLYTSFQAPPPTRVMETIQEEVAAIMLPVGIRLEWRSLPETRDYRVAADLAVISFKGRCDISGMKAFSQSSGVLGLTHVSEGEIIPFADVDCDRIRGFLQGDLMRERARERERLYGRAIARVVAHELYHIFANTPEHGSCGIGKSAYFASELLSDDFHFEKRDLITLRNGPTMINLENAANASNEAPLDSGTVGSVDVLKHTVR